MYTMPFSSLASASMVIGNLASQNEILALRSSGIHIKHIFRPIIVISLVFSALTLLIANKMIPMATEGYKSLYTQVLQNIPTLELKSYSSTRFGKRVIANGLIEDNIIHDVTIIDETDKNSIRTIVASEGKIVLLDIDRFIYQIELKDADIIITDSSSSQSYSVASAQDMVLYLSLASNASAIVNVTPSQMSLSQLSIAMSEKKVEQDEISQRFDFATSNAASSLGSSLIELEKKNSSINSALIYANEVKELTKNKGYSFYYQYYRSEYHKKIALSLACTFLVFVAFPISFFKVKNGRLIGFGISMFVACAYWFFIYYMHVKAVSSAINPIALMWAPNAVTFIGGTFLLWRTRK